MERKTITVSKTSRVKLSELWSMLPFLVKLLFEVLFSSCILIFSHLLYVSLKSVAQHGEVTYHQEGELIIETFVSFMAFVPVGALNQWQCLGKRYRCCCYDGETVPKQLQHKRECVDRFQQCRMSTPTEQTVDMVNWNLFLDWRRFDSFILFAPRFIVKIYGLYCVIIVYKWNLAYAQRLRTNVMAIHFPKREKKRILYLYNECLKNRKRLCKMIKRLLCRKLRNAEASQENPLRVNVDRKSVV